MTLDWQFLFDDDGSGRTYLAWLFDAWGWTLAVSVCAWLVALVMGTLMGMWRTWRERPWLARLGTAWVELFRNIPVLVQVFLWYFVMPRLVPPLQQVPGFALVVVALGFFTSARIAEQVRAGLESLPRGQRQAALALGLSPWQVHRHVLLPMTFRIIWPPLTSESMGLIKNTSVAFSVSVAELTLYAMQVQEETSRGIEVYLLVTLAYALTALGVYLALAWCERRLRVPGFIGPANPTGAGH